MTNETLPPPVPRKSKSEIYWELVEALKWYVAEDDINEGDPENEYWIAGKNRAKQILKMVEKEHTEPQYVIHKATRLPYKESYSGPTWDDIGLRYAYAATYTDLAYAEELAQRLTKANPVGFIVSKMPRYYVIHESINLPGKKSYNGPVWDDAGLRSSYADTYSDVEYARELAYLLTKANPIGFVVSEIMPRNEDG